MALTACSQTLLRICFCFSLCVLYTLSFTATTDAQTATYHLHREASSSANRFQLKPVDPDSTSLAIQSVNLKNLAVGEYLIKEFDTQSGVPNSSGTIPAGSTISFTVWLRKTSNSGTIFPRAKLNLNSSAGSLLGTATGATALTTTLTKYTFSTTTSSNVSMNAGDRFYLWVGVSLTTAPTTNTNAELDIEGTPNGNFDSFVVAPLPPPAPSIGSVSPSAGPVGTTVAVTGSNFGATQGTSTLTFNGVSATPSSWSGTNIVAAVPAGATTGPVVVTAGGIGSNGVAFTVADTGTIAGTISRASNGTGIGGALVEALQSGVVKGSANTSGNGSYSIGGLISSNYDVRASANRFLPQILNGVVVLAPATTTANFSLVDAGPITNVYDSLGRLVGVIDPARETATYTYDAVGNLLSISRYASTQVSLIQFSPHKGPQGAPVTIYGTGFSLTPSQNTVRFNGTDAVVISSTATQIATSVPAGATTGPITVITPSGTATSTIPFTVGSDAPVITSFTPAIGTAGTTVNISGSNFENTASGNRVDFNETRSIVAAATATSLTTTVPAGATSGRISDTTPAGTGVSNDYFFIPPGSFTAADVEVTGQMAIGESKTVTIATANKIAMILFEGTAGLRISLRLTGVTIAAGTVFIYKPDGSLLGSSSIASAFIDTQTLPVGGTYTILVDPSSTNTGSATLNLNNIVDFSGTTTIGGPSATVIINTPGQNGQLTFAGTAGQRVSLTGTSTFGACWTVGINNPDGSQLASLFSCGSSSFIEPQTLPVSGDYSVVVNPSGPATGQATVNLYDVVDFTGTINFGGPTVSITTNTPGQNGRLTFTGSAGQRVSVNGTSTFGACWNLGIYKPDGTQLTNVFSCGSGNLIEPLVLPETGVYTILVDPTGTAVGGATIGLFEVTDVTGPITIGGPAVIVTLSTPGQNAQLSFDGAVGQRVSVNGSSSLGGCWNLGIYKPDGTQLANTFSCGSGIFIEPQTLPVSGAYTLVVDPSGAATGQATVALYDVVDVSETITINGPSVIVSTPTPGQNANLTFTGAAGQRVSANSTSTMTGCWTLAILKPDGTQLASIFSCGNNIFIEPQVLPSAGTYTVLVNPNGAATGQATISLFEVVDVIDSITIDGPAVSSTVNTPGQNARLSFSGSAGQRVSANSTSTMTGCWTLAILKPDGTQLASVFSCGNNIFIEPQMLPETGVYTLLVDPLGAVTGQATVNLYNVVDVTGTITLGGPAVNVTTTVPGQNASLTFGGTTGQQATVRVTGSNVSCVRVTLLKPDGSSLTNTFSCGSAFNLSTQTLPSDGTYTITIDPSGANKGSMSVSLTNP